MTIHAKIRQLLQSDNSLSLIGNFVFAFFGFANVFILARTYSEAIFGEWLLYLAGMALFEMVRKGITSTPLVRFVAGSTDKSERSQLIGSGWILSIGLTVLIVLLLVPTYAIFGDQIDSKSFGLFFKWYPVLAVLILPLNTGLAVLQADRKFGAIINLRLVNMSFFFLFNVANWIWFKLPITTVVFAHLAAHLLASLYAMFRKWAGIRNIRFATKKSFKLQLNFGKFSLGTLLGSNLLKSSDSYIIGIMMTSPDVAYYGIPLKLIEVIEIPMRSFVAVAFPKMSKASRGGDVATVKSIYYKYAGLVTWLFIPMVVVLFFAAKPLTLLLGGEQYIDSYIIFQVFLIYALFLPVDRFSGVTLDAINRPKLNMIKVIGMASANIIGDILVITFFESLTAVACITILNVLTGVVLGNWFLRKQIGINALRVLPEGFKELKRFITQIRR